MTSLPRAASRRSPLAVIEPSGNASAAATSSRSGSLGLTSPCADKLGRVRLMVRLPPRSRQLIGRLARRHAPAHDGEEAGDALGDCRASSWLRLRLKCDGGGLARPTIVFSRV